jgi:hypothetical protein
MKIGAVRRPACPPKIGAPPAKTEAIATPDQVDCDLARPAAVAALGKSLQWIAAHQMGAVASSLCGLPAAGLMFHGTAAAFARLEPRPNQRIGLQGQVEWSGTAIFAAMDPRVALAYTVQRHPEVSMGISLRRYTAPDQTLQISLYGGANLEDALSKAYGEADRPESCRGYIHLLDRASFVHEKGLGCMEKITRDSAADLGQIQLNRRAALEELRAQGLVTLQWHPR